MINEDAKVSLDMKRAETILKFRKLNNFFLWVISVLFTTEQLCDFLKNSLKNLQRRNTGRGQIRKLKTPLQDGLVFPEIEREKLDKFFEVCDWNLVEAPLKTVDLSNLQDRSLGYFVQIIQNHEKEVRKRQRDVERHLNQICRFCEILENRQRLNLLSTEEINQLQEFRENEKTLRSIFQNIVKSVNEIDFVEDFSEGEVSEEDDSSMSVSEMSEEEDIQITEASDHPSSSCHNDITTVEQFKCFTNKDENESKLKEEEIGEVQPPTSAQTEMSGEEDVSMEEQKEPPSTSCNRDIASLEKEASGCKTMDYDMENENFEIESKERHCEATDLSTSSQEKITCTLEKMEICGPSLEDYLKNNFISQETIEPTTNPIPFSIERAALGRKAVLGDFYDACRDTFVGGNIFNRGWPERQICKTRTMSRMLNENRVSSKVDVINTVGIEDELLLSFLTLNVQVSGSAELLNEKRNFVESTHNVVTLKMKTEMEMVNLAQMEFLKFIGEPKNLNGATHVVVGIQNGCHAHVDISSKDTPVRFKQTETQFPAVEIKVFSDTPSGSPPSRVEDIKEFLDKIGHEAENTYQQVPIGYIMLDIKEVAQSLEWTLRTKTNYKPLSKRSAEKCLELLRNAEGIYKSFNVERKILNEIAGEQFKSKEQYNLQRFKRILKSKMGDLIRQSREDQKTEKNF